MCFELLKDKFSIIFLEMPSILGIAIAESNNSQDFLKTLLLVCAAYEIWFSIIRSMALFGGICLITDLSALEFEFLRSLKTMIW